jgi:hypothetical protein
MFLISDEFRWALGLRFRETLDVPRTVKTIRMFDRFNLKRISKILNDRNDPVGAENAVEALEGAKRLGG